MHRVRFFVLALVFGSICANADQPSDRQTSFEEFRKNVLSSYESFREDILKDYDKFLENAWVGYTTLEGEVRNPTPKPDVIPAVSGPRDNKVIPPDTPPLVKPLPQRNQTPLTSPAAATVTPNADNVFKFDFYGIPMSVEDIDLHVTNRLTDAHDYACQWRELAACVQSAELINSLTSLATGHKFNDYLTFDLVRTYVNARYVKVHPSSRVSLTHYILANMGYDVRMAYNKRDQAGLLIPFDTKVYGRPSCRNANGTTYYLFSEENFSAGETIYTHDFPVDTPRGRILSLRLNEIDIPVAEKDFDISYGDIHLTGKVNANLFPIIYHYPQMEIGDYASSVLDPDLRKSIVTQVREQLVDKSQIDAINHLLQFTQMAFDYATDEQAHGFEKPYFFEETLFYPQCDCEDRAIFYSYLLWNALGVENQLITFPGHESAAVALPNPIKGRNYKYQEQTFYISDPTYIGAVTGQCMPAFENHKPEIEYHYK